MSESAPPADRTPRDFSLAALRKHVSGVGEGGEAAWVAWLSDDERAGARQLAKTLGRRAEVRAADAARVSRLFELRETLFARGLSYVAGVDEVGVGPLAGPVVAAAVILPRAPELRKLNDSKQVTRKDRERLDREIREQAISVSVAEVSSREVDRLNILQATLVAMRRAVMTLGVSPQHVLVDARTIPGLSMSQTAIVNGDARDATIAAASIVAKVYRDAVMAKLDARFPGYGFAQHKGYGTRDHLGALASLGPSDEHRRSFAPVAHAASP